MATKFSSFFPLSDIYICSVSGLTVNCQYADTLSTTNITGIAIGQSSGPTFTGYVVDNANGILYSCPITNSNPPSISCPSSGSISVSNNPEYITVTGGSLGAYVPFFSTNGVLYYPISGGSLITPSSTAANASVFSPNSPYQAQPNGAQTYAWVSVPGANSVYICPINSDSTFGSCTVSNQIFSNPVGIAIL